MTVARNQIVDVQTTRYYHYISKVVRGEFLMGDGYEHRKARVTNTLLRAAKYIQLQFGKKYDYNSLGNT